MEDLGAKLEICGANLALLKLGDAGANLGPNVAKDLHFSVLLAVVGAWGTPGPLRLK